jgi:hypothetical protein
MRPPTAVGVNVTWMVQLAPGLRRPPQVLVWVKSPGLTPPISMEYRVIAVDPAFDSVTVYAALEVPSF